MAYSIFAWQIVIDFKTFRTTSTCFVTLFLQVVLWSITVLVKLCRIDVWLKKFVSKIVLEEFWTKDKFNNFEANVIYSVIQSFWVNKKFYFFYLIPISNFHLIQDVGNTFILHKWHDLIIENMSLCIETISSFLHNPDFYWNPGTFNLTLLYLFFRYPC